MKKICLILILFLIGCTLGAKKEESRKINSLNKSVKATVILVRAYDREDVLDHGPVVDNSIGSLHTGYCAGSYISKNKIITAAHCVGDNQYMSYFAKVSNVGDVNENGEITEYDLFQVVKFEDELDLAILESVSGLQKHSILKLGNKKLQAGQKVYAIGSPVGLSWSVSQGIVSRPNAVVTGDLNANPLKKGSKWTQVSTNIYFGNSGGPLVTRDGSLVGVASWIYYNQSHLAFFVHPDNMRKFLNGE